MSLYYENNVLSIESESGNSMVTIEYKGQCSSITKMRNINGSTTTTYYVPDLQKKITKMEQR